MAGRGEAFERLYRSEYGPLVGFFARRIGDPEVARDLAADTFRIAWTKWHDPGVRDRGWLFGVARHLLVDEYRRRERDQRCLTELGSRLPSSDRAEHESEDVRSVLAGMSAPDREVLQLTYWDGLDARDVGTVLGISRSAVWVRLHRARRAFAAAWSLDPMPDPLPGATR